MAEAMATGRMSADKKAHVGRILKSEGLNISQAINLLFDKIEEENSARILTSESSAQPTAEDWAKAAAFVDSISEKRSTKFDNMTKTEIRVDRLRSRGLM